MPKRNAETMAAKLDPPIKRCHLDTLTKLMSSPHDQGRCSQCGKIAHVWQGWRECKGENYCAPCWTDFLTEEDLCSGMSEVSVH